MPTMNGYETRQIWKEATVITFFVLDYIFGAITFNIINPIFYE